MEEHVELTESNIHFLGLFGTNMKPGTILSQIVFPHLIAEGN